MNLIRMIGELRNERQRIDEAIITIERLASVSGLRRRGRPPKWLAETRTASVSNIPRKRKPLSQRKRWARTA